MNLPRRIFGFRGTRGREGSSICVSLYLTNVFDGDDADEQGIMISFVQSENNIMKKTSTKIQNNDV